jgi:ATP-dependent helicase/nuclease subunit A
VDLYQEAKKTAGQLDFNDLLFGARELMRNDDARGYFQGRFTRIFVDEFQDTDPVQAEVLLLLAAGDALQHCRRSVQPILDFVNAAFEPLMKENYLALTGGRPAIDGQPSVIALPMPAPYGKKNFSAKAIEKCAPDAVAGAGANREGLVVQISV